MLEHMDIFTVAIALKDGETLVTRNSGLNQVEIRIVSSYCSGSNLFST